MNGDGFAVGFHASELYLPTVSGQLKKQSRLQQDEQHYADDYGTPIRHGYDTDFVEEEGVGGERTKLLPIHARNKAAGAGREAAAGRQVGCGAVAMLLVAGGYRRALLLLGPGRMAMLLTCCARRCERSGFGLGSDFFFPTMANGIFNWVFNWV
ncbi:hypothetical protein R6Q59_005531 [Mikania micrantha]